MTGSGAERTDGIAWNAEALEAVDAVFRRFMADEHVPGLVTGLVRRGGPVHLRAYGVADVAAARPVDADTVFRIASMTKNVTALTLLALRDEGLVDLDSPVVRYAPEATSLAPPTSDSRAVSVRDLLVHTAGFVTDDPWGDRELGMTVPAFDRLVSSGGLFARPPGVAFEYSNLGYALLGRVLTNVGGRPYQAVVADRLLRPLGMTDTTFDIGVVPEERRAVGCRWRGGGWSPEAAEPDGEFGAMGGLATTAHDYARYLALLLDAWPPRSGPDDGPVRRASIRELGQVHSQPWAAESRELDGEPYAIASAYGYGLVSSHDVHLGRTLHHAGGLPGYGSHVLFSPDVGVGLFAFANRTYAPAWKATRDAALALKAAGRWTPPSPPVDARLAAAAAALLEAFRQGRIEAADAALAANLLADEPACDRDEELADLKRRAGEAESARIEPRHALAGRIALRCARGEVAAQVSLVPGPQALIQMLKFERMD